MDSLIGVWGAEQVMGPALRGELTLLKNSAGWRASICGIDASARESEGELFFDFPGDSGSFRCRLPNDGDPIEGHWIQPPGLSNAYSYATPLRLHAAGSGVWRGNALPLDDLLHMYLVIEKQADDTLSAYIRDPEHNIGLRFQVKELVPLDNELHFLTRGGNKFTATYGDRQATISLMLPFYPVTLDFTKRTEETAHGFYPRTPPTMRYTYREPLPEHDGWDTAGLQDVGLDPGLITTLVEQILNARGQGLNGSYIQALLIARHGKLALEEYFHGYYKERPHDMRSATKTLTATLVGLALDQGAPFSLTTPVCSLFPEYAPLANDDPLKQRITVERLLTMTSGLECDDDDEASAGNEDTMQDQETQPDWYKYTLDLPVVREPGGLAVYCSAGINLLAGVVSNSTSAWLPDFFRTYLASLLDFGHYHLQLTPPPLSTMYGGGGSYFRPRDLMKLGQLFLADGRWNGKQVVSADWVRRAWTPHSHLQGHDYGYGWHLGEYLVDGHTYFRAEAGGNGGQFVIVMPELDLVVMFTAANYGDFGTWRKFRDELVPQYVIPAARRSG